MSDEKPMHCAGTPDDPYLGSKIGCDCGAIGSDEHWSSCALMQRTSEASPRTPDQQQILDLKAENRQLRADIEAESAGNASLRERFGALEHETFPAFVERLAGPRTAEARPGCTAGDGCAIPCRHCGAPPGVTCDEHTQRRESAKESHVEAKGEAEGSDHLDQEPAVDRSPHSSPRADRDREAGRVEAHEESNGDPAAPEVAGLSASRNASVVPFGHYQPCPMNPVCRWCDACEHNRGLGVSPSSNVEPDHDLGDRIRDIFVKHDGAMSRRMAVADLVREVQRATIEADAQRCERWASANRKAFPEQALAAESCAQSIREQRTPDMTGPFTSEGKP